MAEKKEDKKIEKEVVEKEKEYVIPLREKIRVVPRYKKTNKAVKTIKEFLVRHMKIRDRDLKKIRLDTEVNEFLWSRGIKNPPHKIKVKVKKDGELVRVNLVDVPKKLAAKKAREEKREKKAEEEKEKNASVVEEGKKIEKSEAKKMKHTSKKQQQSMVSQRQNLQR